MDHFLGEVKCEISECPSCKGHGVKNQKQIEKEKLEKSEEKNWFMRNIFTPIKDTAKNLVTKVRVMHDNLPSWLKGKCLEDNRLS